MKSVALTIPVLLALAAPACGADEPVTRLAVFNFQLKTATPKWAWLEKFLSDQIATDFATARQFDVVARDEMQLLASKMSWIPEMAADAGRMGQVRSGIRIDHLVSGVCGVTDETVEITGQIIAVSTRKELFRKTVSGKAGQVLELQKQLSAELLGWFLKKPADDVLPTLPVWTKSIPAVEALYEGMDLYDHGRYADAWLKFRQASRNDPGYVEALYWVGKMYYFMGRYEHARLALERFVYIDAAHPRLGDAIKEYLDTYERLDAPPESLLQLYASFRKRWPEVSIVEPSQGNGKMAAGRWLGERSCRVLAEIGRYEEAARAAAPAYDCARLVSWGSLSSLVRDHQLTGRTPALDVLMSSAPHHINANFVCSFAAGQKEQTTPAMPIRIGAAWTDSKLGRQDWKAMLIAPDRQVFTKIAIKPSRADADQQGNYSVHLLFPDGSRPFLGAEDQPFGGEGVAWANLPRSGLFLLSAAVWAKPGSSLAPFRVVAEFEPAGSHGSIQVRCGNTADYLVWIDGRPSRHSNGLVGLLSPGPHTVKLSPLDPQSPYDSLERDVAVTEGKIALLAASLPWKKSNPWSAWAPPTLIGNVYSGHKLTISEPWGPPSVLLDDKELRLVWSFQEDLWTSASADGNTFSPPRKMELPLSSAWTEKNVRLIRDEGGRYLMFFQSDRDAQHRDLCYVTWSRDFVHWAAPAAIDSRLPGGLQGFAAIQDSHGRFLLLTGRAEIKMVGGKSTTAEVRMNLLSSPDGLAWRDERRIVTFRNPIGPGRRYHICQLPDGGYEALVVCAAVRGGMGTSDRVVREAIQVVQARSSDLADWQVSAPVLELPGGAHEPSIVTRGDRREILFFGFPDRTTRRAAVTFLWREAGRPWMLSPGRPGLADPASRLAYHPRWGYCLFWMSPSGSPGPNVGPFMLRGRSLDPMLAGSSPAKEIPPSLVESQGSSQPQDD